jgi:hypothetical protein
MTVSIAVANGRLRVAIDGLDRFWALSAGVDVPLSEVLAARVVHKADAVEHSSRLRLPGSYWPGVIRAGSYGVGSNRELWCVHRTAKVLVVDLTGQRYRHVVVEVADPEHDSREINKALPEVRLTGWG